MCNNYKQQKIKLGRFGFMQHCGAVAGTVTAQQEGLWAQSWPVHVLRLYVLPVAQILIKPSF